MANNAFATPRKLSRMHFIDQMRALRQDHFRVDPEFDTDANDNPLTGVGLDHRHQGNGARLLPI